MPVQPIKIPQNVYIEDRIVGPLTLRQIIIVGIGCGFSYAIWSSISKAYGYVGIPLTAIVWIPGVISVMFAFVRVNDVSLFRICLLMLERINKPSTRTFSPRPGISINIRTFTAPSKELRQSTADRAKAEKIDEISSVLDTSFGGKEAEATEDAIAPRSSVMSSAGTTDAPESPAPPRPVLRERIKASPGPANSVALDGISSQPRVSIFRDITQPQP